MADINNLFLPEDFTPIGETHVEETGRPGLELIYDSYGVPHVYGETRADLAFGAGWTTARDRGLLIALGRGPARAAVADVPNLDAFSLVTSGRTFEPSAEAEALVTNQRRLLVKVYGDEGRQIIADAQAYADGINAYWEANGIDQEPATVNDVIAVTAFIGSIFGAGGGAEAANADLLAEPAAVARPRAGPGGLGGRDAGRRPGGADDDRRALPLRPPHRRQGDRIGRPRRRIDREHRPDRLGRRRRPPPRPGRQASNFLLTAPERSATGNSLAVMGPQLGYYYPEIVQQIDLHGPGINAQGVAVPGLAMYMLIGRTQNYAWSLTSAGHDVRDVYAERLCEPDGSQPSRDSTHYRYRGKCQPVRELQRGPAGRGPGHLRRLRARARVRHRHRRRQALRAVPAALDLRARRAQPRGPQGHDRG